MRHVRSGGSMRARFRCRGGLLAAVIAASTATGTMAMANTATASAAAPAASPPVVGIAQTSTGAALTQGGATADIDTCNAGAGETWTVDSNGTIVGVPSGKCLEVAGGSTANYAGVDIATCSGASNQQWTVHSGGTIVGTQSGKCLSVTGASTANGATADIYTCNYTCNGSETWTEQ